MKILVIGASGGSGRAVYEELLDRGHTVTAFSRGAAALPHRPGLTRVAGDATDAADLDAVVPGHDAIVITLGISEPPMRVRLRGAGGTPDDVRSRGTAEVLAAARRAGIDRIVVQSSYGVGPTRALLPLSIRLVFALLLKPQIADTEVQERLVRDSGLDWTLVQPVTLDDSPASEPHLAVDGRTRRMKISRRSVARVHADLATSRNSLRETISVSG